jgi:hypothetical protein
MDRSGGFQPPGWLQLKWRRLEAAATVIHQLTIDKALVERSKCVTGRLADGRIDITLALLSAFSAISAVRKVGEHSVIERGP